MGYGSVIASLESQQTIFKRRTAGRTTGDGVCSKHYHFNKTLMLSTVYTCQNAQPKRCSFFLWDDEAKPREAAAVLNNSRTEPRTPVKPLAGETLGYQEPITPYTPSKAQADTPSTQGSTLGNDEELFDWAESDDETVSKALEEISMPPPETPRKAVKIDALTSPGKRGHENLGQDVFTTPATGAPGMGLFGKSGLPSPAETPTKKRSTDVNVEGSELHTEILHGLRDLKMSIGQEAESLIKSICNRYALKTSGIAKGRDISRAAIKGKDEKIAELQGRIAALEAERETNKAVIRHLRRDFELAKNKAQ